LAGLALLIAAAASAQNGGVNALLIVDNGSFSPDDGFHKFLAARGARLMHSYPPHAFMGSVPETLDTELSDNYGVSLYRAKVGDPAALAGYGENALFAVNIWNRRFDGDAPPSAGSGKLRQAGQGDVIKLSWDEEMKADGYRLRISADKDFKTTVLETRLIGTSYDVFPGFFPGGVYYWRVSGLFTLNSGGRPEIPLTREPASFSVPSRAAAPAASPPPAPELPPAVRLEKASVVWPGNASFRRYRMQISSAPDFSEPIVDIFTATASYKLSGLPLERETTYYMRVMGAEGPGAGAWSGTSELVLANPGPILNDTRRPNRTK
jgi:hypothetical protein